MQLSLKLHFIFNTYPAKIAPSSAITHSGELKPIIVTACMLSRPSCIGQKYNASVDAQQLIYQHTHTHTYIHQEFIK